MTASSPCGSSWPWASAWHWTFHPRHQGFINRYAVGITNLPIAIGLIMIGLVNLAFWFKRKWWPENKTKDIRSENS